MFNHSEKTSKLYKPVRTGLFSRSRSHYKIAQRVNDGSKVLDVGCGAGYLAELLKEKKCYTVGIEVDEEAALVARTICDQVIVADIERLNELPFSPFFFDRLIFADVLEHLQRPDLVLMRLRNYLSPQGLVIAVIPNMAWAPIRLKLLLGKFDYEDSGHLDKGHLRFFTLDTARQLLTSSGYEIVSLDFIGLKVLPTLFAMKFLIVARPGRNLK